MSSIELAPARLAALKAAMRRDFIEVKSAHLTEALAASLGFRTHAALQTEMRHHAEGEAPILTLDEDRFIRRLQAMGYSEDLDPEFYFELYTEDGVVSTEPLSAFDIEYTSQREKAWRNLMVLAINAGLEQQLFTLRPGDNRWPGATDPMPQGSLGQCFDFTLPTGEPVRSYVADAGFNELTIHVAVNPKGDWVKAANAGFHAGDAFAAGWLERETGAWLQSATTIFNCRRFLLATLAGLAVLPQGYGDKGRVIM